MAICPPGFVSKSKRASLLSCVETDNLTWYTEPGDLARSVPWVWNIEGKTIHSERHAAGVSWLARCILDAPDRAEMVAVTLAPLGIGIIAGSGPSRFPPTPQRRHSRQR